MKKKKEEEAREKKLMQKIFNRVRRHLLKQKECAFNNGACVYRAPNGLRCAIGALIKDEVYCKGIEGAGIHSMTCVLEGDPDANYMHANYMLAQVLVETLGAQAVASYEVRDFLYALQALHDDEDPEQWERALARFASEMELE